MAEYEVVDREEFAKRLSPRHLRLARCPVRDCAGRLNHKLEPGRVVKNGVERPLFRVACSEGHVWDKEDLLHLQGEPVEVLR